MPAYCIRRTVRGRVARRRYVSVIATMTIILTLVASCGTVKPTTTSAPLVATTTPVPPTATDTPLPVSGRNGGLIAFVSDRDGNGEIYVMKADGSDQRRLTHFRDFEGVPTWSPDAKQIAFYTHLTHNKWVIQVMDADGGNQRSLTDNTACDGAPFWSPDGTRIVFTSAFDCDPDSRENG